MASKMTDTICWECKNSCGGCTWSRFFIPVEGWRATFHTYFDGIYMKSYNVEECPEFIYDGYCMRCKHASDGIIVDEKYKTICPYYKKNRSQCKNFKNKYPYSQDKD